MVIVAFGSSIFSPSRVTALLCMRRLASELEGANCVIFVMRSRMPIFCFPAENVGISSGVSFFTNFVTKSCSALSAAFLS